MISAFLEDQFRRLQPAPAEGLVEHPFDAGAHQQVHEHEAADASEWVPTPERTASLCPAPFRARSECKTFT
jgi:hypothetical protein